MLIREMKPDELPAIVRIYVDTFKATHKGVVSDTFLNALSYESALPRFEGIINKRERHPFCFVAADHDTVVGYALSALAGKPPPGYPAELKTMYILPAYQHMGIGRSLIRAVAERFQGQGIRSLFVRTFQGNYPARSFYESLGAQKLQEDQDEIGGEEFTITTYGWASVQDLISSTGS